MNKELNFYDIMWKDIVIGTLREEWGDFGQELSIKLDPSKEQYYPMDFEYLHENYRFDDQGVMDWIEDRIIPRTQDGVEEVLEDLGLSEYIQWDIFVHNNGMSFEDDVWVKFKKDYTYIKNHPRYEYLKDLKKSK